MANSATLVVTATPNPEFSEEMQAYLGGVMPLLMKAGGKLIKRQKVAKTICGSQKYGMILLMDFESAEALEAVFASEAYQSLVPARDKGFANLTISFAADMPS